MAGLTCLFIIQGEGRGHLTQALALDAMLRRAGHRVCSAIVSQGGDHSIPAYFAEHFSAPVEHVEGVHFVVDKQSQSIHWPKTVTANSGRLNLFGEAFSVISAHLKREQPDVIINFYEPLGGFFMLWRNPQVPMIAVAHQFMFLHPRYRFPEGFAIQRQSTRFFTNLTGLGATRRLALSLYDAEPLPSKRMVVVPPLLRDELFTIRAEEHTPFLLVYLFHHSLADSIIAWHKRNPSIEIHCYWNNTGAGKTVEYDSSLTFHQLHGQRFLEMMAACQGIVTTSGFETMAEAMYLGKPLLCNPVRRHFEQYCNAMDGKCLGAAVQSDSFDLGILLEFVPRYQFDATGFRRWVARAERMFVREIEEVAGIHQ